MTRIKTNRNKKLRNSFADLMSEYPKSFRTANQNTVHAYVQTLSTPQLEKIIAAHAQFSAKRISNLSGNGRLLEYLTQSAIFIKNERRINSRK